MLNKHLRILLLTTLLIPMHGFAAEPFNLKLLQNLFKTYQRQQAYDYASRYVKEMEGDPYFDYLYGVSAIDTGHASEGVFALERVLLAFPEDHVARLELARGYFILEEYARSRQEFEIVLKTRPPKGVQQTAQLFIDKIRLKEARYRTTSTGYIEVAVGTDTNVNSAPTAEFLTSFLANPDTTSAEQDDTFSELTASWQTTYPYAPGWLVNGAITGSIRKNTDWDQFDSISATIQAGITRLYKHNRYKAGITAQQYNLDGETFRKLNSIDLGWHYDISQKSNVITNLQYASLVYPTRSNLDSKLMSLGITYSHTFASALSPAIFISFNLGSESAENQTPTALSYAERDIKSVRAGVTLGFSNTTALQFSSAVQNSQYADDYTNRASFREDDHISSELNLLWLFKRDWRLDTRISYSDNRSNVEIYRYDRTQFSLNLNYAF